MYVCILLHPSGRITEDLYVRYRYFAQRRDMTTQG